MKTQLFIKASVCILFLNFTLLSCSSDDAPVSESEISQASGTYELIEINISPAQDLNDDGVTSTNLMDEINCISGTLSLRSNGTYGSNFTGINVTSITNDQFFIDCSAAQNSDSNWNIENGIVTLFADISDTPYRLAEDRLTKIEGNNLPGIQSIVYLKQ